MSTPTRLAVAGVDPRSNDQAVLDGIVANRTAAEVARTQAQQEAANAREHALALAAARGDVIYSTLTGGSNPRPATGAVGVTCYVEETSRRYVGTGTGWTTLGGGLETRDASGLPAGLVNVGAAPALAVGLVPESAATPVTVDGVSRKLLLTEIHGGRRVIPYSGAGSDRANLRAAIEATTGTNKRQTRILLDADTYEINDGTLHVGDGLAGLGTITGVVRARIVGQGRRVNGGGTVINVSGETMRDRPAIALNGAVGSLFSGFTLQGDLPAMFDKDNMHPDEEAWFAKGRGSEMGVGWVPHVWGIQNPNAGIAVDPYSGNMPTGLLGEPDGPYPETDRYSASGAYRRTTGIIWDDMRIRRFMVGLLLSPAIDVLGSEQTLRSVTIDQCFICISSGGQEVKSVSAWDLQLGDAVWGISSIHNGPDAAGQHPSPRLVLGCGGLWALTGFALGNGAGMMRVAKLEGVGWDGVHGHKSNTVLAPFTYEGDSVAYARDTGARMPFVHGFSNTNVNRRGVTYRTINENRVADGPVASRAERGDNLFSSVRTHNTGQIELFDGDIYDLQVPTGPDLATDPNATIQRFWLGCLSPDVSQRVVNTRILPAAAAAPVNEHESWALSQIVSGAPVALARVPIYRSVRRIRDRFTDAEYRVQFASEDIRAGVTALISSGSYVWEVPGDPERMQLTLTGANGPGSIVASSVVTGGVEATSLWPGDIVFWRPKRPNSVFGETGANPSLVPALIAEKREGNVVTLRKLHDYLDPDYAPTGVQVMLPLWVSAGAGQTATWGAAGATTATIVGGLVSGAAPGWQKGDLFVPLDANGRADTSTGIRVNTRVLDVSGATITLSKATTGAQLSAQAVSSGARLLAL